MQLNNAFTGRCVFAVFSFFFLRKRLLLEGLQNKKKTLFTTAHETATGSGAHMAARTMNEKKKATEKKRALQATANFVC